MQKASKGGSKSQMIQNHPNNYPKQGWVEG